MLKNTVFESVSRDKKDCWDKTGLLGAWLQSNQLLAVTRAAELFPNLDPTRRGHDDDPRADPEPDTAPGSRHGLGAQPGIRSLANPCNFQPG